MCHSLCVYLVLYGLGEDVSAAAMGPRLRKGSVRSLLNGVEQAISLGRIRRLAGPIEKSLAGRLQFHKPQDIRTVF